MASTYLTRTPSGAGTNSKIFTLSLWIKRCGLGASQSMMGTGNSSGYSSIFLEFNSDDKLRFAQINAQGASPTFEFEYITNRVFRDVNAWYHIVCTVDSTDSTEADRVKIYVNGVRETSFSTTNHAGSNSTFLWNDARVHSIGRHGEWSARYQNGVMSHIHNIDGTAYQASTFGSTDATTGEWKINTSPSVTYGTNGFFVLKDGNSGTDQSPNTNNFTVGAGTLTKTEDNPSNVFATMNPLNHYEGQTFSNGNTNVQTISGNGSHKQFVSTLGVSSGKFYWELKNHLANTSSSRIGISSESVIRKYTNLTGSGGHVGDDPESYAYVGSNGYKENNDSASSYGNSFQSGDILMVALDMDNNKVYFGKNGTWQNSGDPTSGSTGTGAAFTVTAGLKYYPACSILGGGGEAYQWNFGNGYFKTTAISSAGTNASALGIFEYDVPAGYSALCTKGLNL